MSVFICLVDNWLPVIVHYEFVLIWNDEKCYYISSHIDQSLTKVGPEWTSAINIMRYFNVNIYR